MIISFSSAKGGVAKTSSCVNLAYALAKKNGKRRILVIDLDPQCGTTHHLSAKFNRTFKATLYEVFTQKCNVDYAIHEYLKNFHLLPATIHLRKISLDDFAMELKKIAGKLKKQYDFVFFDLAPSMYSGSTVPLFISDYVIIPVNCPQGLSLLGLQAQAEIIVDVRKNNKALDVLGILPTFVDRTLMSKEVMEYLQKHYDEDVLPSIRKNTTISQASSIGKTIFEHAPHSNGAKDYTKLATEFLKRVSKISVPQRKRKRRR